MAGPGDEMAAGAAGRGPMRASHADREQVIEALKDAFAHGRLTKDELDARAGRALAARTCAELAALTADFPSARAASGPTLPLVPVRRRPLARAAAGSGGCLALAAAAVWASFILDPGGPGADRPWAGLMVLLAQWAVIAGVVGLVVRGDHLSAAATLWQAVAAPAGAGRPRPRRRTARWRRPWLGSPRPPGRPDLRRSAGSQLTAWSAMSFWAGYPGAPKRTSGTGCRVTGHPRPSASLDPTRAYHLALGSTAHSITHSSCYNFSLRLQGRTFGAQRLTARAVNSENGREQLRGRAARVTRRKRLRFNRGSRRCGAAASLASFGRWPYGHGGGPRTAPPVTGRLRSPPYPAAAPAITTARPTRSRQMRRSAGGCHSQLAGTPRIVRAGPSSVKGTRRSFLTASQKRSSGPTLDPGDLCQPSGPDGEGQARGQARSARGEPLIQGQGAGVRGMTCDRLVRIRS
jgi:hypothetical protein